MYILVLMAGEGKRFIDAGIDTPKPLIKVGNDTILERTTKSLPFISHDGSSNKFHMIFAVRKEHIDNHQIDKFLYSVYGKDITIVPFEKTTRGNLETAVMCLEYISDLDEQLLILDSDNQYKDTYLVDSITRLSHKHFDTMLVCSFFPIDQSDKWAFVKSDEHRKAIAIVEKDIEMLYVGGRPMVGSFWFNSASVFKDYAEYIIKKNIKTGIKGKEEFFISTVPQLHIAFNGYVFDHHVYDMVPLGTPEDVEHFKSRELLL